MTEDGPDINSNGILIFHPRTYAKEIKVKDCFPVLSSVKRQIFFFLNKKKGSIKGK